MEQPVTKAALRAAQVIVGPGKTWTYITGPAVTHETGHYIPPLTAVPISCFNTLVMDKKLKKSK